MFTGIIEATGSISAIEPKGGDKRIRIHCPLLDMQDVALGDSIAVNGVCLTVVEFDEKSFAADVSLESIERTGFAHYSVGSEVNLEKALQAGARLGGHMVSGHVDGIGEVIELHEDARSWRYTIEAPKSLAHYIAEKGSITIDGISLTVNSVDENRFGINIVPHTHSVTTMKHFKVGTRVNLEVDLVARYLERLLTGQQTDNQTSKIDEAMLARTGFLKS